MWRLKLEDIINRINDIRLEIHLLSYHQKNIQKN